MVVAQIQTGLRTKIKKGGIFMKRKEILDKCLAKEEILLCLTSGLNTGMVMQLFSAQGATDFERGV